MRFSKHISRSYQSINILLNEDQIALRNITNKFAKENIAPIARKIDNDDYFD